MVFVPHGTFTMGADSGDMQSMPAHQVTLEGFYIDVFETSNARFKRFAVEAGRSLPPSPDWTISSEGPVVEVTWDDANEFARHFGKSLPTEAQWERAARYPDGRAYPWGSEWKPSSANFCDSSCSLKVRWRDCGETDGFPSIAPIESIQAGKSALGLYHMAGNVGEWCLDWMGGYPPTSLIDPTGPSTGTLRVCRGGSWLSAKEGLTGWARRGLEPISRSQDLGFRTVVQGEPTSGTRPSKDREKKESEKQ
jgi:formylglycine-generating enzyme required for sulfatase activity